MAHAILYLSLLIYNRIILSYYFTHLHNKKSKLMQPKQKMMLFVNEPIFLKHHLRKADEKRFFDTQTLNGIFTAKGNVERFRNLEEARNRVTSNKMIDKRIVDLINKVHQTVKKCEEKNKKLQKRKNQLVLKYTMQFLKQEIANNVEKLKQLVEKYSELKEGLHKYRSQIERIIKITEIKKALQLQNKILKDQNYQLKLEEKKLDDIINKK